jgi:hypothetical protein
MSDSRWELAIVLLGSSTIFFLVWHFVALMGRLGVCLKAMLAPGNMSIDARVA